MIHTQRKAFSMLTAIVVIVTMATIAAYVTSTAGKAIKVSTDQYRKEQAMLLAKSYTEYAIMAVSANVGRFNVGGCLQNINANVDGGIGIVAAPNTGYRVRVRIAYIGTTIASAGINSGVQNCAVARQFSNNVQYNNTPLSMIIDTYIDYRDINSRDIVNNRNMNKIFTYHRRSLQKI